MSGARLQSAVMANMARRAAIVASLTLSADAFLAPLPAATTMRLQRSALGPLRGARVRTGLSTLQAAAAAPLGRGPQVTQPGCPCRLVPPVGRCISTCQPRSLLLHQSCQNDGVSEVFRDALARQDASAPERAGAGSPESAGERPSRRISNKIGIGLRYRVI
jgi:hypothetical protein